MSSKEFCEKGGHSFYKTIVMVAGLPEDAAIKYLILSRCQKCPSTWVEEVLP